MVEGSLEGLEANLLSKSPSSLPENATRESRDGIKPAGGVIPPEGPLHIGMQF